MSIARDPPPKCPNHPTTDMVLLGEKAMKGHESSDDQGIALWYCPLEVYGTQVMGDYNVKGDPKGDS